MKKNILRVLLFFLLVIANSNAQIYYGPTNTAPAEAGEVGEPSTPNNGTVQTAIAPLGPDNRTNARTSYQNAGIPNSIIDLERFLGNGKFSRQISDMWAVKQTGTNVRKVTSQSSNLPAPSSNVIYITSRAELDTNRANIASNSNYTFVFQGWINPGWPISVGSNTTIWVDGTLSYDGTDAPRTATGAAFTPRPSKYDGVFNIRPQGTFLDEPSNASNVTSNKNLIAQKFCSTCYSHSVEFVNIFGTRNGQIIVAPGNYIDPNGQTLPQVNGITIMNANNVNIEGVTIKNSLQGIFLSSYSHRVNFRNNFIDNTLYRAIHLKGAWNPSAFWGNITNNLITNSKFDGIDIDSYASDFIINENVVIGARDRLLIWSEIDANNNLINNNVGILLDSATEGTPLGNAGKGAYQENGTESQRDPSSPNYDGTSVGFNGTNNNSWTNNHSFYAEDSSRGFDGFVMRKERYIQFNNITFTNNYVWTTNVNLTKHNPKYGVNNDVYYLIAANNDTPFYMVNRETGKKVRPLTDLDGSTIIQGDASLTGNYVRWDEVPTSDGYFYLRNVQTGMYFRPSGDNDGDLLEQRPNSYSGNYTQWKKVYTTGDYFYLQNRETGKYFRPIGDNNDSSLEQRPTSYSGNYTQWIFQSTSNTPKADLSNLTIDHNLLNVTSIKIGSTSKLNINMSKSGIANVQVFDITGNKILSNTYNLTEGNNKIIIPNIPKGIYIAHIQYEGGRKTIKFHH
ncbi:RICIN domain-containing protein [Wenyingzhuangia sp. IMCC45574]